jgi:hypothetical protein
MYWWMLVPYHHMHPAAAALPVDTLRLRQSMPSACMLYASVLPFLIMPCIPQLWLLLFSMWPRLIAVFSPPVAQVNMSSDKACWQTTQAFLFIAKPMLM